MSLKHLPIQLPRNAFNARNTSRAGDVWRAIQDAAVGGSSQCGWPPARYVEEKCAFVVRSQAVVHHREFVFGEAIEAQTWVERFRRGMFSTRQTRLEVAGACVVAASQEWVHVRNDAGVLTAARASDELLACFQEVEREPLVTLPDVIPRVGPTFGFTFTSWFTAMDPLDHANHPAYVDWCDEAIARRLHEVGLAPLDVVPLAEEVRFKSGVQGGVAVEVQACLAGCTPSGEVVFDFRILAEGTLRGTARLVRTMVNGPEPLLLATPGGL